ncbi:MAG: hypothetical protein ACLQU3_18805 [Limisphaerales bacterium]
MVSKIGVKTLAGAAACGLVLSTASAGNYTTTCCSTCAHVYDFVDIRGVVTVNGVPTPGVQVEALCCGTGQILNNCSDAQVLSTALVGDTELGGYTNYALIFNNSGTYGTCTGQGCSTLPMYFGVPQCYTPWNVELVFTYQGCTTTVSCAQVEQAYLEANCYGEAIICVNMQCPPPCPACVDPSLGLGAAAGCTILELGAAQVSLNGPAGGVIGNVYIAPGGKANWSGGGEYLTGNVYLGTGATYQNSGVLVSGSIYYNQNLSAQIDAAYAAAALDAGLPCTQVFTTLDGKSVTTIFGQHGLNVICVQNIVLHGTQIKLTGYSDTKFVFNVTGQFVLTGGGNGPQIRVDTTVGLAPSDVLYNIIGTGQDVAFSGGGGGANCCAAIVDGTLLAPQRKINLSPGLVNGEVISGMDISIVSGSGVHCPPCSPATN